MPSINYVDIKVLRQHFVEGRANLLKCESSIADASSFPINHGAQQSIDIDESTYNYYKYLIADLNSAPDDVYSTHVIPYIATSINTMYELDKRDLSLSILAFSAIVEHKCLKNYTDINHETKH